MFGADVVATGVQPVWIEVQNASADVLWLLRSGTDPDYFSPREVAWSVHAFLGGTTNDRIDEHFDRLSFAESDPARADQERSAVHESATRPQGAQRGPAGQPDHGAFHAVPPGTRLPGCVDCRKPASLPGVRRDGLRRPGIVPDCPAATALLCRPGERRRAGGTAERGLRRFVREHRVRRGAPWLSSSPGGRGRRPARIRATTGRGGLQARAGRRAGELGAPLVSARPPAGPAGVRGAGRSASRGSIRCRKHPMPVDCIPTWTKPGTCSSRT